MANVGSFAHSFERETDRAVVVIVAARIDEMLKEVIQQKLMVPRTKKDSFVKGMPFKSRIELAYRLALLPATLVEPLMQLAELRNDFAHSSKPMELEHAKAEVKKFLEPVADVVAAEIEIRKQVGTATLRDEFLIASSFIVSTLSEQIANTKRLTSTYQW